MPVGVGAKPAGGAVKPVSPAAPPAKPVAPPSQPPAGAEKRKDGKLKIVLIIVLILVLLAGLAIGVLFALKYLGILGGSPAQPEDTQPVMGEVTVTTGEPINVNLEDGYLSFAATVYFDDTVTAGEGGGEIDNSPARNAAYLLFKGMSVEDLNKAGAISELQEKYLDLLNKDEIQPYQGHVVAVRFTQFAYQ